MASSPERITHITRVLLPEPDVHIHGCCYEDDGRPTGLSL